MWILRHGPLQWGTKSEQLIEWESFLERCNKREGSLKPTRTIRFERPLEVFGPTVERALDDARTCVAVGGARLHGMSVVELRLAGVEASFDVQGNVPDGLGILRFEGALEQEPPFPFSFDGPADQFFAAMLEATRVVDGLPFVADAIRETPDYWVFPARTNGCLGAIFDRRAKCALAMGSAFPIELWIWGHERGLFDAEDSAGDLVVTEIPDRNRAVDALRRLGIGFKSSDLDVLPLVLRRAATWKAIPQLHDAGDSLVWHVERASAL